MLFHKNLLVACLSTAFVFSSATHSNAGFEWVPAEQKSAAEMAVKDAPVTPVVNEALQPAPATIPAPITMPKRVVVRPSPAPIPQNDSMMPLPMEQGAPVKMQTTANAPVNKATPQAMKIKSVDMQPQSLTANEKQIDLPAVKAMEKTEKVAIEQNAPIILAPQNSLASTQPVAITTPPVRKAVNEAPVIKPFPIMRAGNKADPMVQMASEKMQPKAVNQSKMNEIKPDAMGFGKDMPLALAIQQIIPTGYSYSFAKSVNPGERVSWNGGKPWDVVLTDTLNPIGMGIVIQNKNVMVVDNTDSVSLNTPSAESVLSIEPAAGTPDQIRIEKAPATDLKKPVDTNASARSKISDPGESASQQPDLEGLETSAVGVSTPSDQVEINIKQSSASEQNTMQQTWSAQKGQSLKKVLYSWGNKTDTQIIWEASHDYTLDKDIAFEGSLENAYQELFATCMNGSKPNLRFVKQNKNSSDMALIIVQDTPKAG